MEKKDPKDLNTIYEEFELGHRVERLRGRRIKVKRLVKKENGDYTLRDDSTFLNETNEQIQTGQSNNPNLQNLDVISQTTMNVNFNKKAEPSREITIEKKKARQSTNNMNQKSPVNKKIKNPLYYSTNNSGGFQMNRILPKDILGNPKDSIVNQENNFNVFQTKKDILRNIDWAPDRRNKTIFKSQVIGNKGGNFNLINNNIFKLPANVNSFLDKENVIKEKVQTKTNIERKKAFDKIDELKKQINFVFDDAKARISQKYEGFLDDFMLNINNFKSLCVKYKKSDSWIKNNQGENNDLQLKSISYFNKTDNSLLKKEKTEMCVDSFNINKVMNRKLLSYLAQSLEKRILHIPKFATTSSTKEFLNEIKTNIKNKALQEIEGIEDLLYQVKHIEVDKIGVKYEHEILQRKKVIRNNNKNIISKSPRNSFKVGRNSVTSVLVERDFVDMRKSMANLNHVFSSVQMRQNLNRFALKKDFDFTFKPFDLGNQFEGKDFNGIFSVNGSYLVYGNEFYYQLNLTKGKIRAFEFKDRNLCYMTFIKSKLSCLRLNKTSFLDTDQTIRDLILIATTNNSTKESEVIIGEMKKGVLNIYKRLKLGTISKIKKILPLKDLYTYITVTEDGMIYLCDLGMKAPKETIDKCKGKKVLSCDILNNQEYFAISQEDKLISLFEVKYQKSNFNSSEVAKKLERVRILKNNAIINQIKSTGVLLFEGVDSNGKFASVDLGKGDTKNTTIDITPLIDKNIDRFFILNNKVIGKHLKKKVIVYLSFDGEVGLYNYENKTAHSFQLDKIKGEFCRSEQNMILNKFQDNGIEVFVVSKNGLLKLYFK